MKLTFIDRMKQSALHFALVLSVGLYAAGCGRAPEPGRRTRSDVSSRVPERPTLAAVVAEPVVETAALQPTSPTSEVGRGLVYRNDRYAEVPWSINLLKIDRTRSDFALTTSLGWERGIGLSTLSEQVELLPPDFGAPIAAINGDFYRIEQEPYAGDPRGLQIMRGELISAPIGKTSFWMDPTGKPNMGNVTSRFKIIWPTGEKTSFGLNEERNAGNAVLYTPRIGASTRTSGGRDLILVAAPGSPWLPLRPGMEYKAEVREVREGGNARLKKDTLVLSLGPALAARISTVEQGAVLTISTATTPDLKDVQVALGGGPVLIHEGKLQPAYANKSDQRHPRSAMGWDDQSYYFVQVDGRQHGFSVGMTLPELAAYLLKQGCQEAMNLDGGGSSELWIEGQIVNRPCFGRERSTANGLVVVRKQKLAGPIERAESLQVK